jgi:hypothetical protein
MGGQPRLARAVASLVGLAALVVAVPALLVAMVGWPLPRGLPRLDQVRTALGDGWRPDEAFVGGLLALVVWVVWAQVMRHVAGQLRFELAARRAAPAGPGPAEPILRPGRGGLGQRLAGWLVGGLMMAAPLAPGVAVASPPARIPVVLSITQAMGDPLAGPGPAPAPVVATEVDAPSYVVHTWAERRDCLWNIAERYLGDPFRWTEIRDLNADRVQPEGRRLGEDPSSWVYPGWELWLPADATGIDVVPAPASPAAVGQLGAPRVSRVAAPPAGIAPAASSPMSSSTPSTSTSSTTTPVVPTPAAAPAASTPATTAPASSSGGGRVTEPKGKGSAVAANPWAGRAALAGALGLPIFALGGWLSHLRRGRVSQVSRARPGRDVVRGAEPEMQTLERRARAIAADQAEEWIDASLRALTAALGESTLGATPALRCVRAGEMGIEVLLAHPFPDAPPGWEAADGGHVWRIPADVDLDQLRLRGAEHPAIAPALVSLGTTPEGPILADLEGFGALSVEGDAERVGAFLAGAALELASASWATGVELRVYGLEGFERLDEAAVADGEALLHEARSTAELAADGWGPEESALGARVASVGAGEPWYPMVVIAGPDADAAVLAQLVEVAAAGRGVAVVAVGPLVGEEWQLIVGAAGSAVLKPLGLDVRVAGVASPSPAAAAAEPAPPRPFPRFVEPAPPPPLLVDAVAAGEEVITVDQRGLDRDVVAIAVNAMGTVAELEDVAAPIPFASPKVRSVLRRRKDCEVWVSVLRRAPEVTGWAHEPKGRRKLVEVLVYLAVYAPKRLVPAGELRMHCWPPRVVTGPDGRDRLQDVSAETFHQAMSRLRKQLGEGVSGWHLPNAVDGAYGIGAGVGCDWTLFEALTQAAADAAARHDTPKAIALYREALQLIEGEPFADVAPGSHTWVDSEHLVTDIRLAVTAAATNLAELAMASEPETAVWATHQGRLLLPTQLGLFDTWMAAAAALGDVEGIDQALHAKCWAHDQLDPDGGIPPETMELYRHLRAQVTGRVRVGQSAGRA